MSRNDTQVNFRIDPEVLSRVKTSAEVNGVSISAELNRLLDLAAPSASSMVQMKIRLPSDLHQFIKGAAMENEVSMNQMMVTILRDAAGG